MPSLRVRMLNTFLRTTVKKHLSKVEITPTEISKTRARMNRMGRTGARSKLKQVDFSNDELGGVPLCWAESKTQSKTPRPSILHMHGGAYFVGSSQAYQPFAANLALVADARVGVLDYRLAPEAPFPAATEDALNAYQALLNQGVPAQRIVMSGDSAGGNLALVTLLAIKEAGLPTPACCVLLSPWTDLTGSGESLVSNAHEDAMLPADRIAEAANMYAGKHDLRDWRISPLFGNYAGLPPLCIHVGSGEILRDDAQRVASHAQEAGVEVSIKVWPSTPHVFPVFADFIPEGQTALNEITQWLNEHLPDRALS